MPIVHEGCGDFRPVDADRLEAVRLESEGLVRRCEQTRARVRVICDQVCQCRSQRELSRGLASARLGFIPVVEQAKGIVMAQQGGGPVEAFDLLRRASQRASVRVHVLAAQLVEHVAARGNGTNVTPISLGAIRGLRRGSRAWPPAG